MIYLDQDLILKTEINTDNKIYIDGQLIGELKGLKFLIESLMISLIGGFIGIALGLGVIFGVSEYFNWKMSLDYISLVLSFVFSSSIGIIFGFYPARKASNLNPIDALRYE